MTARTIAVADKSFPAGCAGQPVDDLGIPLSEFSTPLLTLDERAMQHNIEFLADWTRARGLELMPHGKTTMAPALWRRQLAAGATGITVATGWQADVALRAGVSTVQIANACLDPQALARLAAWLHVHPAQELVVWADSIAAIEQMEAAWNRDSTVGVLVELGAAGGRTGARDLATLVDVAHRVADSSRLTLRGVAGYEGALAHDRSRESLAAVRGFVDQMVEALALVRPLIDGEPWITAGGSAYPDVVAESLTQAGDARTIVRSGAYITHDLGFYREISPFDTSRVESGEDALVPAMWGWARVVSCPEPGLALLDGGKRDFPCDEGLPVPVAVSSGLGQPERPCGGEITALNDQHAFLRWDPREPGVRVGEVVRLGLSHPCTAFDKWRLIPIVTEDGTVVEAVETFF